MEDFSCWHHLPSDVQEEIEAMIKDYKKSGELKFMSNLGLEDFGEKMELLIKLKSDDES